jgi:hypothetical protein
MIDFNLVFILFVIANSLLSFRAGAKASKWTSMVSVFCFLKTNDCLKQTDQIEAFDNWPDLLKQAYTNPEDLIK